MTLWKGPVRIVHLVRHNVREPDIPGAYSFFNALNNISLFGESINSFEILEVALSAFYRFFIYLIESLTANCNECP